MLSMSLFSLLFCELMAQNYPWNISSIAMPLQDKADIAVKTYLNISALYGEQELRFCSYFNSMIVNCTTVLKATSVYAGDFYDDDTGIYFVGLDCYNMAMKIYQFLFSGNKMTFVLLKSLYIDDLPKTLSINYNHRWLAVGTNGQIRIYDILNPKNPILASVSETLAFNPLGYGVSALSFRKNRICTCLSDSGFVCFGVFRGQFNGTKIITNGVQCGSIKVFDDFIIIGTVLSSDIWVYNATDFALLGKSKQLTQSSSPLIWDFFRSSDIIIAADHNNNRFRIHDISNPRNIVLLASSTISLSAYGPLSMFLDSQNFFSALDMSITSTVFSRSTLSFPIHMNWELFFANSEWNGYGRVWNPLKKLNDWYQINSEAFMKLDVVDQLNFQENDLGFTVESTPNNYVLEAFGSSGWYILKVGDSYTQTAILSNSVRIRDLRKIQQILSNETFQIIADNRRGSRLRYNVYVSRAPAFNGTLLPDATLFESISSKISIQSIPDLSINTNVKMSTTQQKFTTGKASPGARMTSQSKIPTAISIHQTSITHIDFLPTSFIGTSTQQYAAEPSTVSNQATTSGRPIKTLPSDFLPSEFNLYEWWLTNPFYGILIAITCIALMVFASFVIGYTWRPKRQEYFGQTTKRNNEPN